VSLQNGQNFGVEALLRWQHPKRGLVQALEILSLAEQAGLSVQLGEWVLRNCCLCLGRWIQSKLVPASLVMSFNLSEKELARPTLVDEIRELLGNTHLDGTSLQVELTETTMMESDALVIKKLEKLRDLGVCIALDDFGRGRFSLRRLQDFPISTLKIDSLFINRVGTDKPQMLDAVVALAQKLKLQVIAEGVETSSQLRYLEQRGSTLAQGFLFSEPVSEKNALHLLRNQPAWNIAAMSTSTELYVPRET
jgi:EAL domain-containing protein (putative c-di-GMP-specific phosphodiesterase class I)